MSAYGAGSAADRLLNNSPRPFFKSLLRDEQEGGRVKLEELRLAEREGWV